MEEFSAVLGLQSIGLPAAENRKMALVALQRLFGAARAKHSTVVRLKIVDKLEELVDNGRTSEEEVTDFTRIYIAFVFTSFLFPTGHYTFPLHLHWYFDNVEMIGRYNWGSAVHKFVCESMKVHNEMKVKAVDRCLAGVMAWLFERVPTLGIPKPDAPLRFRFARWQGRICRANAMLDDTSHLRIESFAPLLDEVVPVQAAVAHIARPPLPPPPRALHDEVEVLRAKNTRIIREIELLEAHITAIERTSRVDAKAQTEEEEAEGETEAEGEAEAEGERDGGLGKEANVEAKGEDIELCLVKVVNEEDDADGDDVVVEPGEGVLRAATLETPQTIVFIHTVHEMRATQRRGKKPKPSSLVKAMKKRPKRKVPKN